MKIIKHLNGKFTIECEEKDLIMINLYAASHIALFDLSNKEVKSKDYNDAINLTKTIKKTLNKEYKNKDAQD